MIILLFIYYIFIMNIIWNIDFHEVNWIYFDAGSEEKRGGKDEF